MKLKKTIIAALALVLLLGLCACGKPVLYTSDRLEVEVSGEGTKTLTLKFFGPMDGSCEVTMTQPEGDTAIFTVSSSENKEDHIKVKLAALKEGTSSFVATYSKGDEVYAIGNVSFTIDAKLKFSAAQASVFGEEPYETISETLPEGSEISKGVDSSKIIRLTSADSPWIVEAYDRDFLTVDELGCADDGKTYEFLVGAVTNGSGNVYLINKYAKQRMTLSFQITSVIDGEYEALSLVLANSELGTYDYTESPEYSEKLGKNLEKINKYASGVFIPASAVIKGCGTDEGYLDISLDFENNELGYLVFKDVTLEGEKAEFKKEYPSAEADSFETQGIKVEIFQLDESAVALWQQGSLLYELAIMDETNIIKAGDIVEAFLSDSAL